MKIEKRKKLRKNLPKPPKGPQAPLGLSPQRLSRVLAYGSLGVYILDLYRKNGTLKGNPEGVKVEIDTGKMLDTVLPIVGVNPKIKDACHKFIEDLSNEWEEREAINGQKG